LEEALKGLELCWTIGAGALANRNAFRKMFYSLSSRLRHNAEPRQKNPNCILAICS